MRKILQATLVVLIFSILGSPLHAAEEEFRFTNREVEFSDGPALLKGTLFMPDADVGLPGVVLLGGSERGPRTPYKIRTAEHFAAHGVAALTYDSPGTGLSIGNAILQTRADRAREALAAVHFLRKQKGIHQKQVGLWGISEGAGVVLLAAAEAEEIAFAIPVSGGICVTPLEQSQFRIEVMGLEKSLPRNDIQKALVMREILFALLSGKDIVEWRLIRMKADRWPDEPWSELVDLTRKCREELSAEEKQDIMNSLGRILGAWKSKQWFELTVVDIKKFERFLAFDPVQFFVYLKKGPFAAGDWNYSHHDRETISRVKCPILAIWGGMDNFVPPNRSAAGLRDTMESSTNKDVTIKIIPDASHIMTVPGSMFEFADGYPGIMTDWLADRFDAPGG